MNPNELLKSLARYVDNFDISDTVLKKVQGSLKKVVQVEKPIMKNFQRLISDLLKKSQVDKSMADSIQNIASLKD